MAPLSYFGLFAHVILFAPTRPLKKWIRPAEAKMLHKVPESVMLRPQMPKIQIAPAIKFTKKCVSTKEPLAILQSLSTLLIAEHGRRMVGAWSSNEFVSQVVQGRLNHQRRFFCTPLKHGSDFSVLVAACYRRRLRIANAKPSQRKGVRMMVVVLERLRVLHEVRMRRVQFIQHISVLRRRLPCTRI